MDFELLAIADKLRSIRAATVERDSAAAYRHIADLVRDADKHIRHLESAANRLERLDGVTT